MVYWKSECLRRYFYFAPDAADNFLESALGMKKDVSGRATFPHQFPAIVAKLGLKWAFTDSMLNLFCVFKCIGELSSHIKKFSELHFKQIAHGKLKVWQPCQM